MSKHESDEHFVGRESKEKEVRVREEEVYGPGGELHGVRLPEQRDFEEVVEYILGDPDSETDGSWRVLRVRENGEVEFTGYDNTLEWLGEEPEINYEASLEDVASEEDGVRGFEDLKLYADAEHYPELDRFMESVEQEAGVYR